MITSPNNFVLLSNLAGYENDKLHDHKKDFMN